MTDRDDAIKLRFDELAAYRDEKGAGLTQQTMADMLNTEGFPSLSGHPWSKYSIRRVLKNLNLQGTASSTPPKGSGRRSVAKPSPAAPSLPATGKQEKEAVEHKLKETSPLMQWNYYESIRDLIAELTSKPYSEKELATKLNRMAVPTADGKPWSTATVSRVLKVLKPSNTVQISEDVIRDRIRLGWYDTESERYIAVAVAVEKETSSGPKQKSKRKDKKSVDNKKDKEPKKGPKKKKKGSKKK